MLTSSDSSTSPTLAAGLCYLTSKGKQLTAGVSTAKVLTYEPFPSVGNEADGRPLHSALIIQRSGPPAYLGKTAAHFGSSANYGHDGNLTEATEKEHYLQLHSCILSSPPSTLSTTSQSSSQPQQPPPLPSPEELSGQYVWMDSKVLLATSRQLSSRLPSPPAKVDLEPLRRFIMYVDGSTGLVNHGGAASTTRTHILIRAHHEGGIHPGQWRVGGEASFGWGGKCQLCTTTTNPAASSSQPPVSPTISIPFDVLCYRPNIPQVLHPYILLPVRPRYLGRGFGNGPISSISDLLAWKSPSCSPSMPLPLPPIPFPMQHGHNTPRRPVIVCHDFKGGYNGSDYPEFVVSTSSSASSSSSSASPISVSDLYTIPWHHVETFIYFTHARVTIPPREWINACHKHGVRCLGTILFEGHDGHLEMMKMLESTASVNAAVDKFVEVAAGLGFDGYLLNCESPVAPQSPFQDANPQHVGTMLRLQMFVAFLTQRLHRALDGDGGDAGGGIGASRRASVIWYDAITIDGHISYQNGITNKNVTFAGLCDGLFTNYWWRPGHLQVSSSVLAQWSSTMSFEDSHEAQNHQKLLDRHPGNYPAPALLDRKALVGIDVFGRGTYGGGGFTSGEAVKEIVKSSQGQGVALFAPAWTLEVAGKAGRSNFINADEKFWRGLEESCDGSGVANRRSGAIPQHHKLFPTPGSSSCSTITSATTNTVSISLNTTGVFGVGSVKTGTSGGGAVGNPFADSKDCGLRRLPFILNFADSFGTSTGGDDASSMRWSQLSAGDPIVVTRDNSASPSSTSGSLRSIVTKPSALLEPTMTSSNPSDAATRSTSTPPTTPCVIPLPFRKGLEISFSSLGSVSSPSSDAPAAAHFHAIGSSLLPVCRGPGVTINTTAPNGDDVVVLNLSVVVESTSHTAAPVPYEQCWYVWVGCGGDVSAFSNSTANTTMALVPLTRQYPSMSTTLTSPRHEMFSLDTASLLSPRSSSDSDTITLFGLATGLVKTAPATRDNEEDDDVEIVIRNLSLFTGVKGKKDIEVATNSPAATLPLSLLPTTTITIPTSTLRQFKGHKYLLDMVLAVGGDASVFSICVFGRFTDEEAVTSTSTPSPLLMFQQGGMQFLGVHSLEGVAGKVGGDGTSTSSSTPSSTFFISTAVDRMLPPPAPPTTTKKPAAMEVCVVPSLWVVPGLWRGDLMQHLTVTVT